MSAYYSTLNNSNGNTNAGNFGISNTVRFSVLSNSGYTSGLNNGGIVQPQTSPVVSTNVLVPLVADPSLSNNSVVTDLKNVNFAQQNRNSYDVLGNGPKIAPGSGTNGINGYSS